MRKCPECGSTKVITQKRINGDSTCEECGYKSKTGDFALNENIKHTFRHYLDTISEDKEVYVIGNKSREVLTIKNGKFSFTKNNNFAYTFDSEKEAIEYEDKHSNDIEDLTYIYKMKNNKLTKIQG